jgi:hypothetical protein
MLATTNLPPYKRRSLRRAVSIDCEIESDLWEGHAPFRATDISDDGLWLRTGLPLECGEQLLVSFAPPRWPKQRPLVAMASVVRVGLPRRRSDAAESGMALQFFDLEPDEQQLLRVALRGLPPPLRFDDVEDAEASLVPDDQATLRPMSYILSREPRFVMSDGTEITMTAEAPLLTGGRPPRKARIHFRAMETTVAPPPLLRLVS